jgi:putative alpha-1,2-mannosidase
MYTALGEPAKTATKIRTVVDSLYKNGPEGLPGNEDCGQMSAWLVWTSIGMYPMDPSSGKYVFGYPLVRSATIHLPSGKKMSIRVKGNIDKKTGSNSYIRKIILNGKEIQVKCITHQQLLKGGELIYELAD